MAIIGVKHLVYAPITTYTVGSRPTYGTGAVLAKLTKVDYSPNVVDGAFYADDSKAEEEHYVSDGTITLGVDDLIQDVQKAVLGNGSGTESTVSVLYKSANDTAPYVGIGFVVPKKRNGSKIYEARFLLRVMFKEPSASAETKGESISFQGTEIEGSFSPVEGYEGGRYLESAEFTTESAAFAWVNGKCNISTASVSSTTSTTSSTSK